MTTKAKATELLPEGPVGRFIACPVNGEAHPELVALEVKRTYDKKGKVRYSAHCPFCNSRCFLNNWAPGPRSRTIVQAEMAGLHPVRVTEERRLILLRELGLQPVQAPGQQRWAANNPGSPKQYMQIPPARRPVDKK